ncbi:fec operon regulator FecR [Marinomonas aquimarina]|uniref:Fec operon regulator FecR n=1 Tax=Marinomonas aquimarina TaxID=295068 RepID=A0A1A8TGB5_9GAMM|nr:FecR domain-containing protein [Marinomonas aquimarina]SBS30997.1 fec operon regulator FecR [Marinomonas aquimarina]
MPPLDAHDQALEEAAFWFACLQDEPVSEQDRQAWQQWLAQSELHQQAWWRIEQVDKQFQQLPVEQSMQALSAAGKSRRQFLYGLAGAALLLPLATWLQRDQISAQLASGMVHQTQVGEVRQWSLADGSKLWLNTNSIAAVDYQSQRRQVQLLRGEIFVEAAPDARPLTVLTDYGAVHTQVSQLTVRSAGKDTAHGVYVSISDGEAAVRPSQGRSVPLQSKQSLYFNERRTTDIESPSENDRAWQNGFLVADNMRLGDFIDSLSRYHGQGWLKCSDNVANLRLIGHFPVADTEKVLHTLALSLPINIRRVTPWFTFIEENVKSSHS